MYVATRELRYCKPKTDKMITLKAGDEIVDFETWDHQVQKAHLNLEWVEKVGGEDSSLPTPSKSKRASASSKNIPGDPPAGTTSDAPAPKAKKAAKKKPKAKKTPKPKEE